MAVVKRIKVVKARKPGGVRRRSYSQDLVPLADAAPHAPVPAELKASCLGDVESMEGSLGALRMLSMMEVQAHI